MTPEASIHREAGSRMSGPSASASAEAEGRLGEDLRGRVLDALGQVYDPELDEPITQLRFVGSCVVTPEGDVDILLRLPTKEKIRNPELGNAKIHEQGGDVTNRKIYVKKLTKVC